MFVHCWLPSEIFCFFSCTRVPQTSTDLLGWGFNWQKNSDAILTTWSNWQGSLVCLRVCSIVKLFKAFKLFFLFLILTGFFVFVFAYCYEFKVFNLIGLWLMSYTLFYKFSLSKRVYILKYWEVDFTCSCLLQLHLSLVGWIYERTSNWISHNFLFSYSSSTGKWSLLYKFVGF